MRTPFLIVILSVFLLTACSSQRNSVVGTKTLSELKNLNAQSVGRAHVGHISQMRMMALKDTAMGVGARAGLAWRSKQINQVLNVQESTLYQTYNFNRMLLDKNVLPPVLVEAQNTLNLADSNTIRLAQKVYKIEKQARFVTAAPVWREYLWMNYESPEVPSSTLLPRNKEEASVWNHYVTSGWHQGIQQANSIFSANMSTLKRDYAGMALYRKMYAANMVSAPFVAQADLGITGDASNMRVNDRVLRITALPELNLRGNTWKATVATPDPQTTAADNTSVDGLLGNDS